MTKGKLICLEHAQQEPNGVQSLSVLHSSVARSYDAPGEEDARLPDMWADALEQEIARCFEDDVADLYVCMSETIGSRDASIRT